MCKEFVGRIRLCVKFTYCTFKDLFKKLAVIQDRFIRFLTVGVSSHFEYNISIDNVLHVCISGFTHLTLCPKDSEDSKDAIFIHVLKDWPKLRNRLQKLWLFFPFSCEIWPVLSYLSERKTIVWCIINFMLCTKLETASPSISRIVLFDHLLAIVIISCRRIYMYIQLILFFQNNIGKHENMFYLNHRVSIRLAWQKTEFLNTQTWHALCVAVY